MIIFWIFKLRNFQFKNTENLKNNLYCQMTSYRAVVTIELKCGTYVGINKLQLYSKLQLSSSNFQ